MLKVGEEVFVDCVETRTDFDAECLGLHICPKMERLHQQVHLGDGGGICLSPNVGQFKVTSPQVTFDLTITANDKRWQFKVTLLSEVELTVPVERYAWIRLGKPAIVNIGERFIDEIDRDMCYHYCNNFLKSMRGETKLPEPLFVVPGLKPHYYELMFGEWDDAVQAFNEIPHSV